MVKWTSRIMKDIINIHQDHKMDQSLHLMLQKFLTILKMLLQWTSQTTPWKHSRYCQTGHWGNTTEHTLTAKLSTKNKSSRQLVPPITMCDTHHCSRFPWWPHPMPSLVAQPQWQQEPPAGPKLISYSSTLGWGGGLPAECASLCWAELSSTCCMVLLLPLNPLASSPLIFLLV